MNLYNIKRDVYITIKKIYDITTFILTINI